MKHPIKRTLLFLLLVPVLFFSCHKPEQRKTEPFSRWDKSLKDSYYFLEDNALSLSDLLKEIYTTNKTLLWEDSAVISEDVSTIKLMLPLLYTNGIREIPCWFISPRIKTTLDIYLTSREVETTARQLLFLSEPGWGYSEYEDLMESVRRFNLHLSDGEDPLLLTPYSGLSDSEETGKTFMVLRDKEISSDFLQRDVPLLRLYKPFFSEKKEVMLPFSGIMEELIHQRGRDRMFFSFRMEDFPLEESKTVHPDDSLLVAGFALEKTILTPIENYITKENRDYALKILSERYKKTAASLNRKTADRFKKQESSLSDQTLSF